MFFKYSRIPSVNMPIPMAVKKLMLNLVFFGSSVGNMPVSAGCSSSNFMRSASPFMPRPCARSSIKILMKIRDDDVVSSSLSLTEWKTCQPIPSDVSRWPKNWAMIRSRLVSKRWMVS